MSKIKLLILFLISLNVISCTNYQRDNDIKLSIGYISGSYEGLLLSNQLKSYLNNLNMLDNDSIYEVRANISHSGSVFITNIDNTSDRERINSSINISIFDKKMDCLVYNFNDTTSQFYVLAASDKFLSNKVASESIKIENTEYFVKKFITHLNVAEFSCELAPYELRLKRLKNYIDEK